MRLVVKHAAASHAVDVPDDASAEVRV